MLLLKVQCITRFVAFHPNVHGPAQFSTCPTPKPAPKYQMFSNATQDRTATQDHLPVTTNTLPPQSNTSFTALYQLFTTYLSAERHFPTHNARCCRIIKK